ncbi:histidine ammonia-lyase [Candidatus Entotheonella palauensis]|uniref:histidine ammonia-lyase n=1 Tax=Candidatus Entotheonella palauensis TaxID=93172 RepID=UPI000B7D9A3F|nr:histidine ammonia-lyase [Candidatus Entotheonella palauensis]
MQTQSILWLTEEDFTLAQLQHFAGGPILVTPDIDGKARVQRSRAVVEQALAADQPVYGVNTGFGKHEGIRISQDQVRDLQRRLILSHAAGVGPPIPIDIVRLMMLLKIKTLGQGYSGCRWEVVEQLTSMLNNGVVPFVPAKGSVGASGDLAPLAHIALVMMGEGMAWQQTPNGWQRVTADKALADANIQPLQFEAKEGLAMINGTQAMTAYVVWALLQTRNLVKSADIIGAISVEALLGTLTAFDSRIQSARPHPGQIAVASNVRRILAESDIVASHHDSDHKLQDAYSLRCMPQVHGAVRDTVSYVTGVVEREINAVTDNPLVFAADEELLSGGNFHGEPVAMSADYLSIALAELASISERRIAHMLDAARSGLEGFLTESGGLNSGFMIAQVTAAALVSENKVLAHPASVDSIPTSADQEDHVSMGMHAARKAVEILENLEHVLAIELLCCVQALDMRAPLKPAAMTAAVRELLRKQVAFWDEDRLMHTDIERARALLRSGRIVQTVEAACGPLD